MKKVFGFFTLLLTALLALQPAQAQNPAKPLPPVKVAHAATAPQVHNVILMIGDGMGLSQVSAALIEGNYAPMALQRAQYIGLCTTYSADDKVTDSAAGATALSSGTKTYNGAIGLDINKQPLPSILKAAAAAGMATGVVVTCNLSHATPAGFVANEPDRNMYDQIAADFSASPPNVMIGGGLKNFGERADGRNITAELRAKGFTIATDMSQVTSFGKGNLAAFLAEDHMPSIVDGRDPSYLATATNKAMDILSKDSPKGFFMMVEGSQIDFFSHDNDIVRTIAEMNDFDRTIAVAFDWADKHPGTLVVVTADHETGGLTMQSDKKKGVEYKFSTGGHTGIMVPVYAYGAGAATFTGMYDNTDIPKRIAALMGTKLGN